MGLLASAAAPCMTATGPAGTPRPESVACAGSSAGGATLQMLGRDRAQVLCASVERVANHAVRLRSECRRTGMQWSCVASGNEFALAVNGRTVTVLYPLELDSWSAYQMITAVGPMTVPLAPAAPRGPRDREDHCALTGDGSDPQVARMTLRCSLWTVEFVKLCGAGGTCRYEPAARRGSDGPRRRGDGRAPRGEPRPGG